MGFKILPYSYMSIASGKLRRGINDFDLIKEISDIPDRSKFMKIFNEFEKYLD